MSDDTLNEIDLVFMSDLEVKREIVGVWYTERRHATVRRWLQNTDIRRKFLLGVWKSGDFVGGSMLHCTMVGLGIPFNVSKRGRYVVRKPRARRTV